MDDWLDEHDVGEVLIMRIPGEEEPTTWTFLARGLPHRQRGLVGARRGRYIWCVSKRRKSAPGPEVIGPTSDEEVRRYRGHWVAVKDGRVVFGAREHGAVYDWLDEHDVGEVLIIRIPGEDEPKHWTY